MIGSWNKAFGLSQGMREEKNEIHWEKKQNFNFWKLQEWLPGIDRGFFSSHFYCEIWLGKAKILTTVRGNVVL